MFGLTQINENRKSFPAATVLDRIGLLKVLNNIDAAIFYLFIEPNLTPSYESAR